MLFGLRHSYLAKFKCFFCFCLCLSPFLLLYAIYLITIDLNCSPGRLTQPNYRFQIIAVCFHKIEIEKNFF